MEVHAMKEVSISTLKVFCMKKSCSKTILLYPTKEWYPAYKTLPPFLLYNLEVNTNSINN